MYRKTILPALLCFLITASVQAQYHPTREALILSLNARIDIRTIDFYMVAKDFAPDQGDGNTYEILWFSYFSSYNNVYTFAGTWITAEKSSLGYRTVTQISVFHKPNQTVKTITPPAPGLTAVPNVRYCYTMENIYEYYYGYNNAIDTVPRTRDEYIARYGDIPAGATITVTLAKRNVLEYTRDYDKGGVPDWAEALLGHWPGTKYNDVTDDASCWCNPCCPCKCTCGYWSPKTCDGTTGATGCTCHETNPDDPPSSDDPIGTANRVMLYCTILYFVCFLGGVALFDTLADSMERCRF